MTSDEQAEPRWCGAGYAVIAVDGANAPDWPTTKTGPCMQSGTRWFAVMLDSSKFAVRFWLCEEHFNQLRDHFALIDKFGYEPPKRRA